MRKFNSTIIAFATLTALGFVSQQAVAGESYVRNSDTRSFSETTTDLTLNSSDWSEGYREWSNYADKIYIDGSYTVTEDEYSLSKTWADGTLTGSFSGGYAGKEGGHYSGEEKGTITDKGAYLYQSGSVRDGFDSSFDSDPFIEERAGFSSFGQEIDTAVDDYDYATDFVYVAGTESTTHDSYEGSESGEYSGREGGILGGRLGGDIELEGGAFTTSRKTTAFDYDKYTVHTAGAVEYGHENFGSESNVNGTIFTYSTENTTAHESAAGNR